MTCRETLFSMLLCFLFAPSPDYPGHSDHKEMTFRLGHCVMLGLVVQMISSLSLRKFFRSRLFFLSFNPGKFSFTSEQEALF